MKKLSEFVDVVLEKMGLGKLLEREEVFNLWYEVIEKDKKELTKPVSLRDDELVVKVRNPALRNELSIEMRKYIDKFEEKGLKKIKRIKFI